MLPTQHGIELRASVRQKELRSPQENKVGWASHLRVIKSELLNVVHHLWRRDAGRVRARARVHKAHSTHSKCRRRFSRSGLRCATVQRGKREGRAVRTWHFARWHCSDPVLGTNTRFAHSRARLCSRQQAGKGARCSVSFGNNSTCGFVSRVWFPVISTMFLAFIFFSLQHAMRSHTKYPGVASTVST